MEPYIWPAKTNHSIFILIKFQMFTLQRSLYFNIFFVQILITYEEIIKVFIVYNNVKSRSVCYNIRLIL